MFLQGKCAVQGCLSEGRNIKSGKWYSEEHLAVRGSLLEEEFHQENIDCSDIFHEGILSGRTMYSASEISKLLRPPGLRGVLKFSLRKFEFQRAICLEALRLDARIYENLDFRGCEFTMEFSPRSKVGSEIWNFRGLVSIFWILTWV